MELSFHACCRPHNFCISRRLLPFQILSAPPTIEINQNDSLCDYNWRLPVGVSVILTPADRDTRSRCGSTLRSSIVQTLKTIGIIRIRAHNLKVVD